MYNRSQENQRYLLLACYNLTCPLHPVTYLYSVLQVDVKLIMPAK